MKNNPYYNRIMFVLCFILTVLNINILTGHIDCGCWLDAFQSLIIVILIFDVTVMYGKRILNQKQ